MKHHPARLRAVQIPYAHIKQRLDSTDCSFDYAMLCDICKSVDFGGLCFRASRLDVPSSHDGYVIEWVPHHTYAGLKAAASKGCELCIEILKGAGPLGDQNSRLESQNPTITCMAYGIPYYTTTNSKDAFRGVERIVFYGRRRSDDSDMTFITSVRIFCEHGKI